MTIPSGWFDVCAVRPGWFDVNLAMPNFSGALPLGVFDVTLVPSQGDQPPSAGKAETLYFMRHKGRR